MSGFGFRMEMRQTQRLSQRQLMEQRHEHRLGLRIELLQLAHGDDDFKCRPEGQCPSCFHQLTISEILKGFSDDPYDIRTTCPLCKHRFIAQMLGKSEAGSISFPFFCPAQTLQEMEDKALWHLKPENFMKHHRSVYASAIFHFGTLAGAFQKIGVTYQMEEKTKLTWKVKVKPYLGRVSDTEIAEIFGVCPATVRRLRYSLKIGRFYASDY